LIFTSQWNPQKTDDQGKNKTAYFIGATLRHIVRHIVYINTAAWHISAPSLFCETVRFPCVSANSWRRLKKADLAEQNRHNRYRLTDGIVRHRKQREMSTSLKRLDGNQEAEVMTLRLGELPDRQNGGTLACR
jgi:hypothetical protein